MHYTVFHGIVAAALLPGTWQASGKLFHQLQQREKVREWRRGRGEASAKMEQV